MTIKLTNSIITALFLTALMATTPTIVYGKGKDNNIATQASALPSTVGPIATSAIDTTKTVTLAPTPTATQSTTTTTKDDSLSLTGALQYIGGLLYDQIPNPTPTPDATIAATTTPSPTSVTTGTLTTKEPVLSATPNAKQPSTIRYETINKPAAKTESTPITVPIVTKLTNVKFQLPAALAEFAQSFSYPNKPLSQQTSDRLYTLAGILAAAGFLLITFPSLTTRQRSSNLSKQRLTNILGSSQM